MAASWEHLGLTALVLGLHQAGNYTTAFVIGAALALTTMASVWILCPKIEALKSKN